MPTYCLPLAWPRHQLCGMLLFWITVLLGAEARRRQLVSPSVGKESVGSERMTANALNWALGEGRVSGCPLVRESAPCLPALPLQSPLVKLFNRKTRANDFYQRAFLAPVSLVLPQPFGILVFDRLNGILEKNTVAQLHRQWVSTSQSKPKIAQRCTYQPIASCLFIYFPGSQLLVDINCALFLETASDYTDNEAPLWVESRSRCNTRSLTHRLCKYFSNCKLGGGCWLLQGDCGSALSFLQTFTLTCIILVRNSGEEPLVPFEEKRAN